MKIISSRFGKLPNGSEAKIFTLKNKNDLKLSITNYGGIITNLFVPDKNGKFTDIVLGKSSLEEYLNPHPFFGALTGRVAGRIGNGKFRINNKEYQLALTDGPNCLHGGKDGWDKQLWKATLINRHGIEKLNLEYKDLDGKNNFPGTISCNVTYALLDDNSLEIEYNAKADQFTPFNPTNHSYFNLNGESSGSIKNHQIQILADEVALAKEDMTLIGKKADVIESLNDFRKPIYLKDLKELSHKNADTHYFLNGGRSKKARLVATAYSEDSGRFMEVLTTEPGVQFYGSISLSKDTLDIGKNNKAYQTCGGFCFETQDYPDSINFPDMGSAFLDNSENFYSKTIYRFSLK